ncbi:hypothetical protein BOX15_Mlig000124g12 [Macrostomum lignano]|uniref:Uncharacterized protein n=1 Tax=Macrostomum lignano TaxID=282301 RepID=A0A267FJ42_9PLAT|nr:hypothetical protein BOX15_Mlig000124g12 [Macrostomum lignano]
MLRALIRAVFNDAELGHSTLSGRKTPGYVSTPANPAKLAAVNLWLRNANIGFSEPELRRAFTRCGETARHRLNVPKRVRKGASEAERKSTKKLAKQSSSVLRVVTAGEDAPERDRTSTSRSAPAATAAALSGHGATGGTSGDRTDANAAECAENAADLLLELIGK